MWPGVGELGGELGAGSSPGQPPLSSIDPERWTNIPLLVKILKLIINELSSVMEANAARQATPAEWSQGAPCLTHSLPTALGLTLQARVGLASRGYLLQCHPSHLASLRSLSACSCPPAQSAFSQTCGRICSPLVLPGTRAVVQRPSGPSVLAGLVGGEVCTYAPAASHLRADDANDMWEDQEEEDDEEEDGLAGQLLSDILATSKYGECG